MRITYRFRFKRKVIIDDHWAVPIQGGRLRVVEEDGYAAALEIVFEGEPLEYAPQVQHHTAHDAAMTITERGVRLPFVKRQLDNAAAFLECFYNVNIITSEFETKYQGETLEEEALITIKSMSTGAHDSVLPLSFDMLARAVMVAEKVDGPRFEATLVATARKALERQEFINSFRYSFLLIESLYGEGQFKKVGLQAALKGNKEFRDFVAFAIKDVIPSRRDRTSATAKLLLAGAGAEALIDHLVEKRGFYFHGNVKRKDAWKPDDQSEAESLALLAIGIATQISSEAASPLFRPEFVKRYYEDAIRAGATIVFHVHIKFREPGEGFDRHRDLEISAPGTKPTSRSALEIAQKCLQIFENDQPASALISVRCTIKSTGETVFEMSFTANDASSKKS